MTNNRNNKNKNINENNDNIKSIFDSFNFFSERNEKIPKYQGKVMDIIPTESKSRNITNTRIDIWTEKDEFSSENDLMNYQKSILRDNIANVSTAKKGGSSGAAGINENNKNVNVFSFKKESPVDWEKNWYESNKNKNSTNIQQYKPITKGYPSNPNYTNGNNSAISIEGKEWARRKIENNFSVENTYNRNNKHINNQTSHQYEETQSIDLDIDPDVLDEFLKTQTTNHNQTQHSNQAHKNHHQYQQKSDIARKSQHHSFPLNIIIKNIHLNEVQQQCFNLLFSTNQNSLITAPTGSGKTLLFEIAIGKVIKDCFNFADNCLQNKQIKIIYLAPIKSLCQEKAFEWKMKYCQLPLDWKVVEATGDSEFINMNQLINANIILTTPERFDVLTRKWKEDPRFVSWISLWWIDEVHWLNEENRGATIEAIVARMKLLSTWPIFKDKELAKHRIIALSATLPNIPEVAEFLKVNNEGLKIFGEEYRPVQVERHVLGYQPGKASNEYMFEKYLDYRLAEVIEKFSEDKPALVFCQTQKGTINAAKQLVNDAFKLTTVNPAKMDKAKNEALCSRISNKQLSTFIRSGIAFHNAGLSLPDRQMVEEGFKTGLIKIICTTSTLAQGVNLPARWVVIKSTNCYRGTQIGYTEYNKMEIDQMVGRAGRPQFDTKGIAIIMTERDKVSKFQDLSSTWIESHWKDNIVEHINAEIATQTIVDINSAVNWIKNTFLFVRIKTNPIKYGVPTGSANKTEKIEAFLKDLSHKIFNDLSAISLINYCSTDTKAIPNALGRKMSKNYILFETMKTIYKMVNSSSSTDCYEERLIDILSHSSEFAKYTSKLEDRKALNTWNKDLNAIKYKLKGSIDTPNKKAYILIQVGISGTTIDQWELRRQQNEIMQSSSRIINCIREYYKYYNDCKGYLAAIVLKKCINNSMWPESDLLMKQLPKIGEKLAKCLFRAGITSFDKLINENPRKIESICGKNSPFGNILIDVAKSIARLCLKYTVNTKSNNNFSVTLQLSLPLMKYIQDDFDSYTCYHVVVVENKTWNKIKFKKKIRPTSTNKIIYFNIHGLTAQSFPLNIFCICDKFLGLDKIIIVNSVNDTEGKEFLINQNKQKSLLYYLNKSLIPCTGSASGTGDNSYDLGDFIDAECMNEDGNNEDQNRKQKKKRNRRDWNKNNNNINNIDLIGRPRDPSTSDKEKSNVDNTKKTKNLLQMIENMKNEQNNKLDNMEKEASALSTNWKLNQISKFEETVKREKKEAKVNNFNNTGKNILNTTAGSGTETEIKTQNWNNMLNKYKWINFNLDFLDHIDLGSVGNNNNNKDMNCEINVNRSDTIHEWNANIKKDEGIRVSAFNFDDII